MVYTRVARGCICQHPIHFLHIPFAINTHTHTPLTLSFTFTRPFEFVVLLLPILPHAFHITLLVRVPVNTTILSNDSLPHPPTSSYASFNSPIYLFIHSFIHSFALSSCFLLVPCYTSPFPLLSPLLSSLHVILCPESCPFLNKQTHHYRLPLYTYTTILSHPFLCVLVSGNALLIPLLKPPLPCIPTRPTHKSLNHHIPFPLTYLHY